MKKLLGIDYGDAYIGLAIGDEGRVAVPLKVVPNDRACLQKIQALVAEEAITEVVVGWPISMSGKENERTRRTDEFIQELERHISIPVHREDERLSSAAAQHKNVKGRDDAVAAAEILQTYLDAYGNTHRTI